MTCENRPHCWGRFVEAIGAGRGTGRPLGLVSFGFVMIPHRVHFVPEVDVVIRAETANSATILSDGFDVHVLRFYTNPGFIESVLARR